MMVATMPIATDETASSSTESKTKRFQYVKQTKFSKANKDSENN